jgi:hypothetical protein
MWALVGSGWACVLAVGASCRSHDQGFQVRDETGGVRLGFPSVIKVRDEDAERHDFGSIMFEGIPTRIEKDGVIVHGRGLGGVFLDTKRDAVIRFNMSRPGRHEFRYSIHPNMTGELLLLSVEAV